MVCCFIYLSSLLFLFVCLGFVFGEKSKDDWDLKPNHLNLSAPVHMHYLKHNFFNGYIV